MPNAKVLLVDDEVEFTATLAERLESRGLDVDVSADGLSAIERTRKRTYDAIVLDLAMPGIDGVETLKRLLAENPDLQVILLTGHATVDKGVEAMRSGAAEVLEKPADLQALLEKIETAQTQRVLLSERRLEDTMTDILRRRGW